MVRTADWLTNNYEEQVKDRTTECWHQNVTSSLSRIVQKKTRKRAVDLHPEGTYCFSIPVAHAAMATPSQ